MSDDAAQRAWQAMQALVLGEDRRKQVATALELSYIRVKALRALAEEPATQRALAAKLFTDAPYTTLIVDDLEQRGLATRTVHPRDRRAKLVDLTAAGHAVAERAQRILDEPPAALRALPRDQLESLDGILRDLLP